jgi:hypothetical protein
MKKIIALTCMMFSVASFALIAPVGRSTNLKVDGTLVNGSLEAHYINVKAVVTIAAGKAVVWDLTAKDGFSVNVSASAGQSPACIMVNTCAIGALCKCQKYGLMPLALFDSTATSATSGARWYMSANNAGYISARVTPLATEIPGGIFYDSASASASVKVFINL